MIAALLSSLLAFPPGAWADAGRPADAWKQRLETPRRWILDWSRKNPDLVLFTSNQRGDFQLYLADLRRGRTVQLTEEPAGKAWGSLSPDGSAVLFVKDALGNEIGQIFRVPSSGGKAEALMPEFPDKSVWEPRWGGSGKSVYFDASDRTGFGVYQFELGGRRAFTVFFSTHEIYDTVASEDERRIAFVHNPVQDDGRMDVYAIDLRSGAQAGLLAVSPGSDDRHGPWAREGPLGRLLVSSDYSGRVLPGVWDLEAGKVTWLETGLEGDVTAADWLAGGRELLLLQVLDARTALWRYDPTSGSVSRLPLPAGTIREPRVRPDGSLWLRFESYEHPPDYYAADSSGTLTALLPDAPASRSGRKAPRGLPARAVHFPSADGTSVQAWLVDASSPASPASRAAVILLHGGPGAFVGDSWDATQLALAERGYATLNLNYRGSKGFGKAFEEAVIGDPAHKELEDLAAARDWLVRERGVSPSSVAVAGTGYGGYLALMALSKQPESWAAGSSLGGIGDLARLYEDASEPVRGWCRRLLGGAPEDVPDLYKERSPITYASAVRAPILLIHGRNDSRAPMSQMDAYATRLKEAGKSARLEVIEGGHASTSVADEVRAAEVLLEFLVDSGVRP